MSFASQTETVKLDFIVTHPILGLVTFSCKTMDLASGTRAAKLDLYALR